mmetsp:Transcript_18824/g.31640  ORF Transcript_18824/g.31640 Transcript_18824/m.31640 type:complete len:210 (-) Transcript_18824:42-671(-)
MVRYIMLILLRHELVIVLLHALHPDLFLQASDQLVGELTGIVVRPELCLADLESGLRKLQRLVSAVHRVQQHGQVVLTGGHVSVPGPEVLQPQLEGAPKVTLGDRKMPMAHLLVAAGELVVEIGQLDAALRVARLVQTQRRFVVRDGLHVVALLLQQVRQLGRRVHHRTTPLALFQGFEFHLQQRDWSVANILRVASRAFAAQLLPLRI